MLLKRNSGFTLAGVLVAAGLTSIIGMTLAYVITTTNKGIRHQRNAQTIQDLTNTVQTLVSDQNFCSLNFVGTHINILVPEALTNISLKAVDAANNLTATVIIGQGQRYQNMIDIESFKLIITNSVGPRKYLGEFQLSLKAESGLLGQFLRKVPLMIVTDAASNLESCSSVAGGLTRTELKNLFYNVDSLWVFAPAPASQTRVVSCNPGDLVIDCTWMPRYMGTTNPHRIASWYITAPPPALGAYSFAAALENDTNSCRFSVANPDVNIATWPSTDLRARCLNVH